MAGTCGKRAAQLVPIPSAAQLGYRQTMQGTHPTEPQPSNSTHHPTAATRETPVENGPTEPSQLMKENKCYSKPVSFRVLCNTTGESQNRDRGREKEEVCKEFPSLADQWFQTLVFTPAQLRNLLSIEIIIKTWDMQQNKSTVVLFLKRKEVLTNLSCPICPCSCPWERRRPPNPPGLSLLFSFLSFLKAKEKQNKTQKQRIKNKPQQTLFIHTPLVQRDPGHTHEPTMVLMGLPYI